MSDQRTALLILSGIIEWSDRVEAQTNELDRFMVLRQMQASIQKNKKRIAALAKIELGEMKE